MRRRSINKLALRTHPMRALAVTLVLALSACVAMAPRVTVAPQASTAPTNQAQPQQQAATQSFTAKLQVAPTHAQVGDTVNISGSGYAPGAAVDLVWYTVDGRYELDKGTEFVGQRYQERQSVLSTASANDAGEIAATITVPLDFGGSHDIRGRVGGQEVSQVGLTIDPTFSMTPSSGPVGTPIEIRIVGVDSRTTVNTWHLLYDNHYTGFLSAVMTHGVATAQIRAAGPVGNRAISVWHNSYFSTPYLNWQDGPNKDVPDAKFTFRVTSDQGAPAVQLDNFQATDNPWPVDSPGPGKLSLSVDRGPVGQPLTLSGSGFPVNTTVDLGWQTMIGNRVGSGFSEQMQSMGSIVTGSDGTFSKDMTMPDDLGGQHRIDVSSGGKVLASAGVAIEPSVISVSPARVHAGEMVTVHLKGLGWTTYDNTYSVTYDNSYIGYACGFSTNGDVDFNVVATGTPGTHLIDLYPTIYKGADAMPRVYSIPQLTYADDHPQRTTPAIRLAVDII